MLFIIILIITYIVLNAFLAAKMNEIAIDKGYNSSAALWLCFLFGFFGCFYVTAMPDLKLQQLMEEQNRLLKALTEQKSAPATATTSAAPVFSDELPDL